MPNPDATPSSLQPAVDLERVLAEIDLNWHPEDAPPEPLNTDFARLVHRHWPTIRAALARERELRELGREIVAKAWAYDPNDCSLGYLVDAEPFEQFKALLAQPAAGREKQTG